MVINLPSDATISIDPTCEFDLPFYVLRLHPEDVDRTDPATAGLIVVAAGTDPRDNKITLVTLTGKVRVFDASRFYVPPGPAMPSHGGRKIFLPNVNDRWPGPVEGFHVDAECMLKNSEDAFAGPTIHVPTYSHEADSKRTSGDH